MGATEIGSFLFLSRLAQGGKASKAVFTLAKVSAITPATATLALATLGDKTNNRIISIDQGKLIRCDIALNIANVNDP